MVSTEENYCHACGGVHPPDPDDSYVDFRGYRFRKPFLCICCGKEICGAQFAFGRACGPCDMGACQTGNRAFQATAVHAHPEWWNHDAKVSFQKYVAHTKAMPVRDIKGLRENSARLKELGIPEKTIKAIDEWIDKEEHKLK